MNKEIKEIIESYAHDFRDMKMSENQLYEVLSNCVGEIKSETIKKIERIKLDMDTVVCDCGSPYKDSDPANLINELLEELTS